MHTGHLYTYSPQLQLEAAPGDSMTNLPCLLMTVPASALKVL